MHLKLLLQCLCFLGMSFDPSQEEVSFLTTLFESLLELLELHSSQPVTLLRAE